MDIWRVIGLTQQHMAYFYRKRETETFLFDFLNRVSHLQLFGKPVLNPNECLEVIQILGLNINIYMIQLVTLYIAKLMD
jgi:hypothetical protein